MPKDMHEKAAEHHEQEIEARCHKVSSTSPHAHRYPLDAPAVDCTSIQLDLPTHYWDENWSGYVH